MPFNLKRLSLYKNTAFFAIDKIKFFPSACAAWTANGIINKYFLLLLIFQFNQIKEIFMNTIQLECFVAVAEHLNFSRASEELKITQPAVSHQIHALEEELGTKLFLRTSKSVSLIPGRPDVPSRRTADPENSIIRQRTTGKT